ncbi:LemA family protein [Nocardia sp. NPDC005746]|uniref:LemA family protein n=1 Tax=Nocardia sp. NPDC005746 TaxID=3157062 RepID=UPI0033E7277A
MSDSSGRAAAGRRRIARRLYNANVRALNTRIQSIPAAIVASLHRVSPEQYFEISTPDAPAAVQVDHLFSTQPDR